MFGIAFSFILGAYCGALIMALMNMAKDNEYERTDGQD